MNAKRTRKAPQESRKPSRGKADFARMAAMSDDEIVRTSPPELASLPADFWTKGVLKEPVLKEPISLRVDTDVLEWFRSQGPRYQSRMNAVLRAFMTATRSSRSKKAG